MKRQPLAVFILLAAGPLTVIAALPQSTARAVPAETALDRYVAAPPGRSCARVRWTA
jgi:hypothetical protein